MAERKGIPSEEEIARMREEARAQQDAEYRRMTPLERMEQAYLLFTYAVDA